VPPPIPVLLQIMSGAKNVSDLVPAGSIYGLEANKSVELTIPAGAIGGPVSILRCASYDKVSSI
jgi:iron transport multicopper oxidase